MKMCALLHTSTYYVHLHPLTNMNILHLAVSEIWPRQDFKGHDHYGNVKGQIKVTL